MQLHNAQNHEIEIIEVSKADRLRDKFQGAQVCQMTITHAGASAIAFMPRSWCSPAVPMP
ncbi:MULTISPECIES: hypothetical protein [unclassified Bradyrhizobium]|uniref:hypothetical protein n=1 Tax=unclassified Bradyrhizobium TaxID=2631580 RepID=UPI0029161425|nr:MULTISPECIES: hypothetical protein [unclassified Bradyrhizobium]